MRKGSDSEARTAAAARGGGRRCGWSQRGGWVGLTLSVRISASAYGMQVTPHNEQAGSQKPLVLHGFTKLGGPEKGGFGGYKPRRLKLIVCLSPYRATRN